MKALDESYAVERFDQAMALLPYELRCLAEELQNQEKAAAEEIRLRTGRPLMLSGPWGEYPVKSGRERLVRTEDLSTVLEIASQASAHAVLDRIREGFITIQGGHRVGLCGSTVVKDGEIHNLRAISSINVRIAREVRGAAERVLPKLWQDGYLQSTLIISPPGCGKTTLLRDLIRSISDGISCRPLRVGVADERGELAALYDGIPMTDVGGRTDILDGCPKGEALLMLLRGMNPQVLAADEITSPADAQALEQAFGCGVALLCTAHGSSSKDMKRRPVYRRLLSEGLFQKLVAIEIRNGERHYRVENIEEGVTC